jgi:uncharacterized protein YndB with AHSA1/START domain
MKNFNWQSFTKRIAIKAPMDALYNAWTVPQEIEKWFLQKAGFENTDGKPVAKEKNVSKNDSYQWSWYGYDIVERGSVLEANGTDLFGFTFAGQCPVRVSLIQEGDYTTVTLTQSDIPTDDKSKRGIRLGCDSGWSFFLVNLKSVYEGGLDLRNKDENLKGMLNN